MISYKRDVSDRQSLSEVKMGRGSPICERVCKKIVEYFKNNVPQRQIAKALQISSSTVHIVHSFNLMAPHMAASVCCSLVLFLFLFVCPALSNVFSDQLH